MQIQYVNLYVSDLERSTVFFRDTLGLAMQYGDAAHGYASFDTGPIRMGVAQVDMDDAAQRALVGRQTGIGFAVKGLADVHARLRDAGVAFPMAPTKQPWGAVMAMFEDPDGNVFYLDEVAGD